MELFNTYFNARKSLTPPLKLFSLLCVFLVGYIQAKMNPFALFGAL